MYAHTTFCLSSHQLMDRHVGCVCLWAFVDNAATNIGRQPSVWVPVFNLLDVLSKSRISESCGNYMFIFLRNKHFHRACPFTFTSPVCEDSNFSTTSSILIIFLLKNCYYRHVTSLVGISGTSLWFGFHSISLTDNEVEHVFMCILAIFIFLKRYLLKYFAHLLIGLSFCCRG